MGCFVCGKSINILEGGLRSVEILLRDRPGVTAGMPKLYFHEECFYEVAGDEYTEYFSHAKEDYTISTNEMTLVNEGQVIQAIKEYRVRTGAGLKEAKDVIDGYRKQLGAI
jgi:hypothetical protein